MSNDNSYNTFHQIFISVTEALKQAKTNKKAAKETVSNPAVDAHSKSTAEATKSQPVIPKQDPQPGTTTEAPEHHQQQQVTPVAWEKAAGEKPTPDQFELDVEETLSLKPQTGKEVSPAPQEPSKEPPKVTIKQEPEESTPRRTLSWFRGQTGSQVRDEPRSCLLYCLVCFWKFICCCGNTNNK